MNKRISAGIAATAALAATAAAQPLDEVVVSASRSEQRSFDAPAAVDAVDGLTIRDAGPQVDLSESLSRVPGITILNRYNYAQDQQLSIRGFGARSTFGIRGVRILVDDIPQTLPDGQTQASQISLTSAERIEVLRGPLAQLYGNAAGGVIQVFTREAPERPEYSLQGYVGSDGLHRNSAQAAQRIGSVGLVADYAYFSTDGFREHSAAQRKHFNGKLSWDLSPATRFTLVANLLDSPYSQDPGGLTLAQLQADPTQAQPVNVIGSAGKSFVQNQFGGVLTHRFDADSRLRIRAYGGIRNLENPLAPATPTATATYIKLDRRFDGAGIQYESKATLGAVPILWFAGADFDSVDERRRNFVNVAGTPVGDATRDEDNGASNTDFFAQAVALLDENWSLTAGLRSSRVRLESADYYLSDGNSSGEVKYSATNPVLGLSWHASDKVNLYANVGRGFETPTLSEVAYTPTTTAPFFSSAFYGGLKAARRLHLEVGAKTRPTRDVRVDAALFHVDSSDEVVPLRVSSFGSTFQNADTNRVGAELSGVAALSREWAARLAFTAIRYTYAEPILGPAGAVRAPEGNRVPGVPERFFFGELVWAPAPANADGGPPPRYLARSHAALEVVYAGKLWADDANTAYADAYAIANLRFAYMLPRKVLPLTLFARVNNLFDREYVGSVIVNQSAARYYEPAPGRNWMVGARLDFAF